MWLISNNDHLIVFPVSENFKMRLPKMNFGGHIVYSRTVTEVEKATAELLKIVETKKKELGQAILGFDIEWRPTFRKGWFRNMICLSVFLA